MFVAARVGDIIMPHVHIKTATIANDFNFITRRRDVGEIAPIMIKVVGKCHQQIVH